jgi:dephospho-CoA kinase
MMHRPPVIGIIGPIGCGKSAIARWLGARGGWVIDADVLAREATGPGQPALAAIRARFGDEVFAADGSLDRTALAAVVFDHPAALTALEAIVHPTVGELVRQRLADARTAGARFVVLEAIKLVESGLAALCDEVWLVECSPDLQRARLAARGMDPTDVERRIAAQGDDLVRRLAPHASRRLCTDGSLDDTKRLTEVALAEVLGPHQAG